MKQALWTLSVILSQSTSVSALFLFGSSHGPIVEEIPTLTDLAQWEPFTAPPSVVTADQACQYIHAAQLSLHMGKFPHADLAIQASRVARPRILDPSDYVWKTIADEVEFCCWDLRKKFDLIATNAFRKLGMTSMRKPPVEKKEVCWYRWKCPENKVTAFYEMDSTDPGYAMIAKETRTKMKCISLEDFKADREREQGKRRYRQEVPLPLSERRFAQVDSAELTVNSLVIWMTSGEASYGLPG